MTAVQQRNVLDGTLKVSLRLDGDSRVVAFAGELDLANAGTADAELAAALDPATARVVIDLAELEFIDSTGIALLVRAWQRLDGEPGDGVGENGGFALCGLNDQVRRLLELSGLSNSLSIHPSREEALAALGG